MGIHGMGQAFNLQYQRRSNVNIDRSVPQYYNNQSISPQYYNDQSIFSPQMPPFQQSTQIEVQDGPDGFWGFMKGFTESGGFQGLFDCFSNIFGGGKAKESQGATTQPTPTTQTTPPTPTTQTTPPTPTLSGTAKDNALLSRFGVTSNSQTGLAQFVEAGAGDISVTGDNKEQPDTIEMKDKTNGQTNTYTYQKISETDIQNGYVTINGQQVNIDKSQFEGKTGPFYILASATNESGTSIKKGHNEVFKLDLQKTDNSYSYNLVQESGMEGSGKSSVTYSQTGARPNISGASRGAGRRVNVPSNWTRISASDANNYATQFPAGTKVNDIMDKLGISGLPSDFAEKNPSIFDINTMQVKPNANWTKLDIPPAET